MKLYHLFPDLMNLYGDYGSLVVLKKALEDAGEPAEIVPVHPGDGVDLAAADLLYMGPGTEPARDHALSLLQPSLTPLRDALLTRRTPALFTGNSWSLLGQSITLARGETLAALGLFDYTTTETSDRYTGDAIAAPAAEPLPAQAVVGFLNRCDKVEGVKTPLFSLQMGKGNDGRSNLEGFYQENCFCTHLIGPLLVKNPHLLSFFASLLGAVPRPLDENSHPALAYQVTLQALQARSAQ